MSRDHSDSSMSEAKRQDCFVRLLSKHSSALYGYILALSSDRHDADDIFQETNVVLLRKWRQFEFGSDFLAWSCTIARYKTLSHLTHSRRHSALDPQWVEAISVKALDAARQADQRREALLECIGKLSQSQAQIVDSRYYRQYSVKEIAEKLGVSSARVYRSLASIHRNLHECVQRNLGGVGG